jgi:hypothetical protein
LVGLFVKVGDAVVVVVFTIALGGVVVAGVTVPAVVVNASVSAEALFPSEEPFAAVVAVVAVVAVCEGPTPASEFPPPSLLLLI